MTPRRLVPFLAAATLAAAAGWAQAGGNYSDYANAWLGEALRGDPRGDWGDLVSRPAWPTLPKGEGPRTWRPLDQNPWANTFGTPSSARPAWRPARESAGIVRLCACYLPDDLRSWDGGPLTAADVARLCRAQCN